MSEEKEGGLWLGRWGKRPRDLDYNGVLGDRLCGNVAGVVEAVGLGLITVSLWGFETMLPTTTRTSAMIVRSCCQQEDVLSPDAMGHVKLERMLD